MLFKKLKPGSKFVIPKVGATVYTKLERPVVLATCLKSKKVAQNVFTAIFDPAGSLAVVSNDMEVQEVSQ